MAEQRYRWVLSPSRFEAADGCPCFEEDPRASAEYKDRGTSLHDYMARPELDRSVLDSDSKSAIAFCDEYVERLISVHGLPLIDLREHKIPATFAHPAGSIDRFLVFDDGIAYVIDWKFGTMPVPSVSDDLNPQIRGYVLMAFKDLEERVYAVATTLASITGVIVQPVLNLIDERAYLPDEIDQIEAGLKETNDRVADPFKVPDPEDSSRCSRCAHITKCPAVSTAIVTFVDRTKLLPMPEQFDPGAIVSVRDRVIAQELAGILISWAERVKENNKEYAILNGGTLGGVYNITSRANGFSVKDGRGLAEELVARGHLSDAPSLLDFVRIPKTAVVEVISLASPETNAAAEAQALVEKFGEPNPPVAVFRKGGKKQIATAMEDMRLPVFENPFKKKGDEG